MTRLSEKQRNKIYYAVAYKEYDTVKSGTIMNFGEFCRGCARPVTKDAGMGLPQGVIDCIPNDGDHTKIENLQLLCRSCNMIKNPRRKSIPTNLQMSYSQKKNLKIEPLFRAYVVNMLVEHGGSYEADRLIKGGAERYGFSIKTAGDYMDKLTSDEGPCFEDQGDITWEEKVSVEQWFLDNEKDIARAAKEYVTSKKSHA